MSVWQLANLLAWVASFALFLIMAVDFLKVERRKRNDSRTTAAEPLKGEQ
jgi:hypothetical protein